MTKRLKANKSRSIRTTPFHPPLQIEQTPSGPSPSYAPASIWPSTQFGAPCSSWPAASQACPFCSSGAWLTAREVAQRWDANTPHSGGHNRSDRRALRRPSPRMRPVKGKARQNGVPAKMWQPELSPVVLIQVTGGVGLRGEGHTRAVYVTKSRPLRQIGCRHLPDSAALQDLSRFVAVRSGEGTCALFATVETWAWNG